MWWRLLFWIIATALTDYLRERLPAVTPSGIGDFNLPTATEGRPVPVITGGTPRVNAPNCIYYSDFVAVRRTTETGLVFKRTETIGYTYELALVYALFKGRCAGITKVWIGDDKVFDHVDDNGSVPATVVDVDRPDLFGGVDTGGGFVGRIRLHNGADDQAVSSFIQGRVPTTPAYRGTSYVVISNLSSTDKFGNVTAAETKGANIGETPNLRHITFEVQAFDTVANGGLGDSLLLGNDHHFIGPDANPISVAYDMITNPRYANTGPSRVNLTNFRTHAETCYTEGIGFTQLIDEQTTVRDVLDIIEQHIDGYIGPNPLTGEFEVKLARQDYTLASEFQSDESNTRVLNWNKGDWAQTYNRIRIRYSDRDKDWKETHAVENSLGNRLIQNGQIVSKEIRYPGCHTADVASKLAAREKRNLSLPGGSGRIEINRTAWQLRPGDVLSFTNARVKETDLPLRITKAEVGNHKKNTMIFDVIEDVFNPETASSAIPPETDFVPPIQSAEALATDEQAATTVPYALMQYDDLPDAVPRILTLATKSVTNDAILYEVIRRKRTTFGSGAYDTFTSMGTVDAGFCLVGELRAAQGSWVSGNGTLTMSIDPLSGQSLDGLIGSYSPSLLSASGIAVINPGQATEEWVAFTSVVDDGAGIRLEGLYRGAFDTPMSAKAISDRIWFVWTGGMGLPEETFVAGEGVEVKLLPESPHETVLEGAATAIAEIDVLDPIRHERPLLPREVTINAVVFPATTVDIDVTHDVGGGDLQPSLLIEVTPRLFRTANIIDQVEGKDTTGADISDTLWSDQNATFTYWLYDLDTTPSPVRGTDELVTGTITWDAALGSFLIELVDLASAGISADFRARLEVEVSHDISGTPEVSLLPLLFDFDITGTWTYEDFNKVGILLTPDDADAVATINDDSSNAHTITSTGNTQSDTAQFQFSPSSILFDGAADSLTVPADASMLPDDGDFTWEGWVRFASGFSGDQSFVNQWGADGSFIIEWASGTNLLRYLYRTTSGGAITTKSNSWNPSASTWYHWAIARKGADLRMFIDGTQIGTTDDMSTDSVYAGSTDVIEFGERGAGRNFDGHMQEVRFTKGRALYVANFTAPAAKFPRS